MLSDIVWVYSQAPPTLSGRLNFTSSTMKLLTRVSYNKSIFFLEKRWSVVRSGAFRPIDQLQL